MEDAHIAQPNLHAVVEDESILFTGTTSSKGSQHNSNNNNNNNNNKRKGKPPSGSAATASSPPPKKKKQRTIPLPGHTLLGVFDGHGGTFAAEYAGANLCRILSKQPLFVQYAHFYQEANRSTFATPAARVQWLRSGVEYLEGALKQAFVELDWEIALATTGTPHPDANQPYHAKLPKKTMTTTMTTTTNNSSHKTRITQPGDASGSGGVVDAPDDEHEDDNLNEQDEDDEEEDTVDSYPVHMMEAARQAAANQARALDDDGDSGTTACCVLVTPDWLVCANAGDSRAVVSKQSSRAVPLSYDHKPDDEGEERRIRSAGGYVAGGRVEGDLAVSRGLGDFRFKHMPTVLSNINLHTGQPQTNTSGSGGRMRVDVPSQDLMKPGDQKVSPVPDIILQTRNPEQDEFVIVACDGIWDVRSNQECVGEVAEIFQEGEANVGLVCEEVSRREDMK